jgi:hypothetical protein
VDRAQLAQEMVVVLAELEILLQYHSMVVPQVLANQLITTMIKIMEQVVVAEPQLVC